MKKKMIIDINNINYRNSARVFHFTGTKVGLESGLCLAQLKIDYLVLPILIIIIIFFVC